MDNNCVSLNNDRNEKYLVSCTHIIHCSYGAFIYLAKNNRICTDKMRSQTKNKKLLE